MTKPVVPPLCDGNGPDHCCYLPGANHATLGEGVCPFLEVDSIPGRRWVCGLMREHGDWKKVHLDRRYLDTVQPVWRANDPVVADCGDWMVDSQCCFARRGGATR